MTCSMSQTMTADEMSDTANGRASRSMRPVAATRSGSPAGRDCAGPSVGTDGSTAGRSSGSSVARASATCPANGTAGSRVFLSRSMTRPAPARALAMSKTGVSVFCASFPLFDAVVTARHMAAAIAERPMNASSDTPTTIGRCPSGRSFPPSGRKRSDTAVVRAIETTLATSVARATAQTARNFPATMSIAAQGAMRSVSIVPRSFSPAIASMAG